MDNKSTFCANYFAKISTKLFHNMNAIRNDIKSYGKFAIISKLKIEGGWVKRANFGKIKTKDRRP